MVVLPQRRIQSLGRMAPALPPVLTPSNHATRPWPARPSPSAKTASSVLLGGTLMDRPVRDDRSLGASGVLAGLLT